jgi:tetratricopeptide (TPR) repeat protein
MAASVQFQPGHAHDLVLVPVPAMLAQEEGFRLLVDHRFPEAIAAYTRADSLGPDSLAYVFRAGNAGGRAFALELLGRGVQALAEARFANELYPGEINARLVLADRALSTGRLDEARRIVDSILLDDPTSRSALLMRDALVRGIPSPGGAAVR